jgi:hypothetical protein
MNTHASQFVRLAMVDGKFNVNKFAELIVKDCLSNCEPGAANPESGYSEDFITGYKLGVGKCCYKIKNLYGMMDNTK